MSKPKGYWNNYENCYNEAKKYIKVSDFSKYSCGAYQASVKNDWLKDYTWFPKQKIYSYEEVYNIAKQYTFKVDFIKNHSGAYDSARRNGWLDSFDWFETKQRKPGSWNYSSCYDAAKTCQTLSEFYTNYSGAYDAALKNNWIKDYSWLKKSIWTYESCCEESKKYKSRSEFNRGSGGAYYKALKNNWLDKFTWLRKPEILKEQNSYGNIYWIYGYFDFSNKTCYIGLSRDSKRHKGHQKKQKSGKYDSVMSYFNDKYGYLPDPTIIEENLTAEEAQDKEGYYVQYFKDKGYNILNIAKTGSLGGAIRKWTYEVCYEEAKKYKTLSDFLSNSAGAYHKALKNKWLDNYVWLKRKEVKSRFWQNYENCYNESKKYKSRSEFQRGSGSAYISSHKNGWLNDFFPKNSIKN